MPTRGIVQFHVWVHSAASTINSDGNAIASLRLEAPPILLVKVVTGEGGIDGPHSAGQEKSRPAQHFGHGQRRSARERIVAGILNGVSRLDCDKKDAAERIASDAVSISVEAVAGQIGNRTLDPEAIPPIWKRAIRNEQVDV